MTVNGVKERDKTQTTLRLLWLSKPNRRLWRRLNGFSHFHLKQNVQLCRNNKRWHLSVGKQCVSLPPLCLNASIHGCRAFWPQLYGCFRQFVCTSLFVRRVDRESNLAINIIPAKREKQSSWRAQRYFLLLEQNVTSAHIVNGFPTN